MFILITKHIIVTSMSANTNTNTTTPPTLESKIKRWVELDNTIKTANEDIKDSRTERSIINDEIIEIVENKQLTKATINISDGKLRFVSTKQTAPLTLGYIEKCLKELITNETQVTQIMTYIKKNREVKTISEIKRYYNEKPGAAGAAVDGDDGDE